MCIEQIADSVADATHAPIDMYAQTVKRLTKSSRLGLRNGRDSMAGLGAGGSPDALGFGYIEISPTPPEVGLDPVGPGGPYPNHNSP